jgi:hypothetical protein
MARYKEVQTQRCRKCGRTKDHITNYYLALCLCCGYHFNNISCGYQTTWSSEPLVESNSTWAFLFCLQFPSTSEGDLKAQGKALEDWLKLSERTFNFARYARIWFKQGDKDTKRAIFACLGSHPYLGGQNVSIEWCKSFSLIFEKLPQAEKELPMVRTPLKDQNPLIKKDNLALMLRDCPTWRSLSDSNYVGRPARIPL